MKKINSVLESNDAASAEVLLANKEEIIGLVKSTLADDTAKSLCIYCNDDCDIAEDIRQTIDDFIMEVGHDEDFEEVPGKWFDDKFDESIERGGEPSCIFVPDAESADEYILENAANKYLIIAVYRCTDDACDYSEKYGDKFEYILSVNNDYMEDEDSELQNESVTSRFARYSKLYESEEALSEGGLKEDELSEEEALKECGITEEEDENSENKEDDASEKSEDDDKDEKDKEDDKEKDESDDKNVDITGIIINVKKDDVDACKSGLIAAGVAEDDIDVMESEDDSENTDIKIDVNSILELKDYLSKKGIDLEKEIDVKIVDDSESSDSEEDDERGEMEKDAEETSSEDNIDYDKDFGDLFDVSDEDTKK